jgi:hypothetical protein
MTLNGPSSGRPVAVKNQDTSAINAMPARNPATAPAVTLAASGWRERSGSREGTRTLIGVSPFHFGRLGYSLNRSGIGSCS